jgi:hypothetical protein
MLFNWVGWPALSVPCGLGLRVHLGVAVVRDLLQLGVTGGLGVPAPPSSR